MRRRGHDMSIDRFAVGSDNDPTKYIGRKIVSASLNKLESHIEDVLFIGFDDGTTIAIQDSEQICCESRYITTDDDVSSLIGGTLLHIASKDGPERDNSDGSHEQVFVEVATDKGLITIVTHNEHNGYYGGFDLTITEEQPPAANQED